jgi:protein ImuB
MVRNEKPCYLGGLTMLDGPERIEAGWWDDALAARDYFIAKNDGQMLLWIYRERPTLGEDVPGWFLHGFFG